MYFLKQRLTSHASAVNYKTQNHVQAQVYHSQANAYTHTKGIKPGFFCLWMKKECSVRLSLFNFVSIRIYEKMPLMNSSEPKLNNNNNLIVLKLSHFAFACLFHNNDF